MNTFPHLRSSATSRCPASTQRRPSALRHPHLTAPTRLLAFSPPSSPPTAASAAAAAAVSAMAPKKSAAKPTRIYFFVPNLIGYARMACSIIAYLVARDYPALCLVLYTASFVLDAVDGMAARALDQCSHFGAILDMLTDRASTAGFLVVLDGVLQPMPYRYTFVLASLLFLDVASHFCRMYASVFIRKDSHKDVSDSIFSLLRVYYSNRRVMGVFCIGQEFAYIFLYAWAQYRDAALLGPAMFYAFAICAVPCFLKQVVNVQQLVDGLYHIACVDAEERAAKGKSA